MQISYSKAIDLLMSDSIDYKAVVVALAKADPKTFISIVEATKPDSKQAMDAEIVNLYSRGEKVPAIKLHRTKTGMGLKESKDYCDALYAAHLKGLGPFPVKPSYEDEGTF